MKCTTADASRRFIPSWASTRQTAQTRSTIIRSSHGQRHAPTQPAPPDHLPLCSRACVYGIHHVEPSLITPPEAVGRIVPRPCRARIRAKVDQGPKRHRDGENDSGGADDRVIPGQDEQVEGNVLAKTASRQSRVHGPSFEVLHAGATPCSRSLIYLNTRSLTCSRFAARSGFAF
jgi:hypothetical protein